MFDKKNFGKRLTKLRQLKGLTQKQVAELLGLTIGNYQRYEIGEVDPPTSKLIKLADYFNVVSADPKRPLADGVARP